MKNYNLMDIYNLEKHLDDLYVSKFQRIIALRRDFVCIKIKEKH